ncbi:TIGR04255 family protein [bacterium]|nr:TIGR04255 family protein [bacterium]MBU1753018.1 TIGR04255 family protein [bacterium]
MSKTYKNPPVIEVLCEFQFVPDQQWDITIPELMYERIKDEFSEKQQFNRYQIGMDIRLNQVGEEIAQPISRMQFLKKDKSALIQLDPDVLIVNHLKPYPAWHQFQPLILKNLQAYKDISHPKGFKHIGLRYINAIEIPKSAMIEEYFNLCPSLPKDLSNKCRDFFLKVDIPYEEGQDSLTIILARDMSKESLGLILDLNYAMIAPEKVSLDAIEEWLKIAHGRIEESFEGCITDKCRMLFEGGE